MADRNRITQQFPSTGARPSEQTAENAKLRRDSSTNPSGMTDSDRLIYQLVQNTVSFAEKQLDDNLKFNIETLTNVLYDNIRELLGEKFNEDEFIDKAVDQLLEKGCIVKVSEPSSSSGRQEPEEEVVDHIDPEDYQKIVSKIDAVVKLIQAHRENIFKILSDADGKIKDISEINGSSAHARLSEYLQKDGQISSLVKRIQDNQQRMDEHVASSIQMREEIDRKVDELQSLIEGGKGGIGGSLKAEKKVGAVTRLGGGGTSSRRLGIRAIAFPKKQIDLISTNVLEKIGRTGGGLSMPGLKNQQASGAGGRMMGLAALGGGIGAAQMAINGFRGKSGSGSQTYLGSPQVMYGRKMIPPPIAVLPRARGSRRMGRNKLGRNSTRKSRLMRIGARISNSRLARRISNSKVGSALRGVGKVASAAWKTTKFTAKVGYNAAKVGYKTTKFAAKTFFKASHFIGKTLSKGAWAFGKGLVNSIRAEAESYGKGGKGGGAAKGGAAGGKGAAKGGKPGKVSLKDMVVDRGIISKMVTFAPATILVKVGWKALKFIGKKLWQGLKKLAKVGLSLLLGAFKMVGKFVNTVAHWTLRLGVGIKNAAYRFLVKPFANIMVTIFGFVAGVVMAPIRFMKNVVQAVFERIHDALGNISQGVKKTLNATISIFKRILFNPITLVLLIGGIFYFLGPTLLGWITDVVVGFKNTVIPFIVKWATRAWNFLKAAFEISMKVGKFLFNVVEWLTNPEGFIAKTVVYMVKGVLAVKRFIKKMVKASGKSDVDVLCMFLAGDWVGLAIGYIAGCMVKMWKWMRDLPVFRRIIAVVEALASAVMLYYSFPVMIGKSILSAGVELTKYIATFGACGSIKKVADAFTKPWKKWWGKVKGIWGNLVGKWNMSEGEYVVDDPVEKSAEIASSAEIAVRSLKMKGTPQSNLAFVEKRILANASQYGAQTNLIARLQNMQKIQEQNHKIVEAYDEFLTGVWDLGNGDSNTAQQLLKTLLESPDLSQKLLSAFFYYNPQTGDTMSIFPPAAIGAVVKGIQDMMNDPDRDNSKAFKEIVRTFEQVNKERSNIVNHQGNIIGKFADDIVKLKVEKNGMVLDKENERLYDIMNKVKKLNKGDLFDQGADSASQFNQIREGNAKTKNLESMTGDEMGTSDILTKAAQSIPPLPPPSANGAQAAKDAASQFKMDVPKDDDVNKKKLNEVDDVVLPPSVSPPPIPDPDMKVDGDGKTMVERWEEHQLKRQQMFRKGIDENTIVKAGYDALSFDEFKKRYKAEQAAKKSAEGKVDEEDAERQANKAKRLAGLRMAKDIRAYHSQGQVANADGFNLGRKPSILKVETDNLSQRLLMFSPEWLKMQGAAKVSDDELMLQIDSQDKEASERIRKAKEEAEAKRQQEEARKKREQQILDYSAQVSGGFIEVKVGEDIDAMMKAYDIHMQNRTNFIRQGHSDKDADKAGLYNFTWEEFKRYYRKMHGMPEDGIRRIPFEGKRKERNVDWSARKPLSPDELAKYGIQVSEEGPVMIPLDKAMQATKSILAGAKTIYSIRDGLEVMSQGLQTETQVLKKRREKGMPAAIISTGDMGSGGQVPSPTPPDMSHYAQVG